MDLSVIIVNWNGHGYIGRCLDSIAAAVRDLDTEVIVVDNCSTDGSVDIVKRLFPSVRVVASPTNMGFGRGAQTGVESAQGKFISIVNPDLVLDPGCLKDLVGSLLSNPAAAWAGPKIVDPEGRIESGAFGLATMFEPLRWIPGISGLSARRRMKDHAIPVRCESVRGSCMVFRSSMLRAVGGMPTTTFMYGEEQILGARFRDQGYEVWYNPLCAAVHRRGSSVEQRWTPDEAVIARMVGHGAAMKETLGRPGFLVYDCLLMGLLILGVGGFLGGMGIRPRTALRLMKLSVAALGQAPTALPLGRLQEVRVD